MKVKVYGLKRPEVGNFISTKHQGIFRITNVVHRDPGARSRTVMIVHPVDSAPINARTFIVDRLKEA